MEPAGYCPHCGYRINPGRCSECGRDVSARRLRRRPLSRRRKWHIGLGLLFLGSIGLIYAYQHAPAGFCSRLPAAVLALFPSGSAAFDELGRRCDAGTLSPRQAESFLNRRLDPEAAFQFVNPCPAGVRLPVTLQISFGSRAAAIRLIAVEPAVVQIVDRNTGKSPPGVPLASASRWGERILLPGLPAGEYDILFAQRLAYPCIGTGTTQYNWTLRVAQPVTVVPRDPASFLSIPAADAIGRINGEIHVQIAAGEGGQAPGPAILRLWHMPAPVLGTLELRVGGGDFRPVCEIECAQAHDRPLFLEVGPIGGPDLAHATEADFRITPSSAATVLERGYQEHYAHTIEWPAVWVARDVSASEVRAEMRELVAFLEAYDGEFGKPYSGSGASQSRLRFEGRLASIPGSLRQSLESEFPELRFSLARTTHFLGWHQTSMILMIVCDRGSGHVLHHGSWLDNSVQDVLAPLHEPCGDPARLESRARAMADFLALAIPGDAGATVRQSDSSVTIPIYDTRLSMSRPYRLLTVDCSDAPEARVSLALP